MQLHDAAGLKLQRLLSDQLAFVFMQVKEEGKSNRAENAECRCVCISMQPTCQISCNGSTYTMKEREFKLTSVPPRSPPWSSASQTCSVSFPEWTLRHLQLQPRLTHRRNTGSTCYCLRQPLSEHGQSSTRTFTAETQSTKLLSDVHLFTAEWQHDSTSVFTLVCQ